MTGRAALGGELPGLWQRVVDLGRRLLAWLRAVAPWPHADPALFRLRARPLLPLLLIVLLLAGCGGSSQPSQRLLLDALALQIRLTQAQVAEALQLAPAGLPQVSRVRVEEQQEIPIGAARGLRLRGRFDWRLAEDPIRVDSPFELFLLRGERGQTWRLARPVASPTDGLQRWIIDPLPLPGEAGAPGAISASGSGAAG